MPHGGSISRSDVAQLQALASRIRTVSSAMHKAAAPLSGLAGHIEHYIGGTATGKDREFAERLAGASASLNSAIADCLDASGGVFRAAVHAEAELRAQEKRDRRV